MSTPGIKTSNLISEVASQMLDLIQSDSSPVVSLETPETRADRERETRPRGSARGDGSLLFLSRFLCPCASLVFQERRLRTSQIFSSYQTVSSQFFIVSPE